MITVTKTLRSLSPSLLGPCLPCESFDVTADDSFYGITRYQDETSYVVDSCFGSNGFPYWCNGEGTRVTRARVVKPDTDLYRVLHEDLPLDQEVIFTDSDLELLGVRPDGEQLSLDL